MYSVVKTFKDYNCFFSINNCKTVQPNIEFVTSGFSS
jgi:hypothetical protein